MRNFCETWWSKDARRKIGLHREPAFAHWQKYPEEYAALKKQYLVAWLREALDKEMATAPAAAAGDAAQSTLVPEPAPVPMVTEPAPEIPADVPPDLTVVPHVVDVSDHVKSYLNKVLDHPGRAIRAICDSRDSDRAMRLRFC